MLVLTREKHEVIIIGNDTGLKIKVEIVDVRGDKVRLGITAPKSIFVHRKEIYDAIQKEKGNEKCGEKTGNI